LVFHFASEINSQEISQRDTSYNYFHEIQLGATLLFTGIGPFPVADISTSHGICFTDRFEAGLGLSTIYFMTLTPYLIAKYNINPKEASSRNTPFLSLKAGYMIYFDKGDSDFNSLHLEPAFGFSHKRKNRKSSWTFFAGANAFQNRIFPKIGIGFEF